MGILGTIYSFFNELKLLLKSKISVLKFFFSLLFVHIFISLT